MPLIGADVYLQMVSSTFAVTAFLGHWGSYKTYTAVLTAYYLLKSKRYKNCYANIPVSFADSPKCPLDTNAFSYVAFEEFVSEFNFNAKYAENSIFILDEAWQKFSEYDKKYLMDLFAFPRKRNQVFLLASAIQLGGIQHYCRYFVEKDFNYQVLGLPLVRMKSYTPSDKKPLRWFIFLPFRHFGLYSTKYQPFSEKPILQYRDYGILYENETMRPIPRLYSDFFVLNATGLGELRNNLTEQEQDIVSAILPRFDIDENRFSEKFPKPPKVKRKFTASIKNILGTEFNFGFMFKFALWCYIILAMVVYIKDYYPGNPGIFESTETIKTFLLLRHFDQLPHVPKQQTSVVQPLPTLTPTIVTTPTITPTNTPVPTATPYVPPMRNYNYTDGG